MKPTADLSELLKNMKPAADKTKYYMATVDEGQLMALSGYLQYIICVFKEDEGLTIVFSEGIKEEMQDFTEKEIIGPFALITLGVYPHPDAVGFLAKITEALAKEKISIYVFSGYHHDHLLVPFERKDDAMKTLQSMRP
ncbi:MAG: ACT domain-containing protein [Candidatus Micrarchaeota archaeon]